MTMTTTAPMIDQVEESLAMLWLQMDRVGNPRIQAQIEEVSDLFPTPEDSPTGRRVIKQAHDIFERVYAEYTPETQARLGHRLVRCPHCPAPGKEGANDNDHAA